MARLIFLFILIVFFVNAEKKTKNVSVICDQEMKIVPSDDLKGYNYHFTPGDAEATSCSQGIVVEGEVIVPEEKCVDAASKGTTKVAYIYFYHEIQSKNLSFKIMCKDGFGEIEKTENVRINDESFINKEDKVVFQIDMTIKKEGGEEVANKILVGDRMVITLNVEQILLGDTCEKLKCEAECLAAPDTYESDEDFKNLKEFGGVINFEKDDGFNKNEIQMKFDGFKFADGYVSFRCEVSVVTNLGDDNNPKMIRRVKQEIQRTL
ncbi:hypothetical protein SNEBB_004416 [Seison nebaliae]|nr:hypothetical protein SNEBB_004416 [Seison nebaliae]